MIRDITIGEVASANGDGLMVSCSALSSAKGAAAPALRAFRHTAVSLVNERHSVTAPSTHNMSTFQPSFSNNSLTFLSAGDGSGLQQVVWEVPVQQDARHGTQPLRIAANVIGGGDDERTLSLEEKLQRERLRQLSTGITGYQVVGSFVYFVQHGSLYRSPLQPGSARDVAGGEAQLVVDNKRLRGAARQQPSVAAPIGPEAAACTDKPILNPKVSPDGALVAFVWGGALYVSPLPPGPSVLDGESTARAYRVSPLPEAGTERASGGASPAAAAAAASIAADVTYGLADYLSEEEFARMEGFWWSPDSRSVCYQRTDASAVPVVNLCGKVPLPAASPRGSAAVDAASPAPAAVLPDPRSMPSRPHEEPHKYPYAGETNPAIALFVADLAPLLALLPTHTAGATAADAASASADAMEAAAARIAAGAQELHLGGGSDVYVPRVRWLPDSGGLLVQVLNRRQDCLDLVHYACAAGEGGAGQLLIRERAPDGWLNITDCCTPLQAPAGALTQHLLWASERTGHRHLYLYAFPASAAPRDVRSPPRGAGAGSASRYDGPDTAAPLAPAGGSSAAGPAGSAAAGERWTYVEPALTGGGTAVEVRAVTAGRWAVEDVVGVVAAAAAEGLAAASDPQHAAVLFHATAQGPTEKHLYAAPVFAWEARPVPPAAAGGDGALAQSLGVTAAMVTGAGLPGAAVLGRLPALWFDRECSPAAVAARVVAAREVACFTEHARYCQLGMLRLTQGPGWHTCVLSADHRHLADELSCAYAPEPALQLCALDKEALLAATATHSRGAAAAPTAPGSLPSASYFAAGSPEYAAARTLLRGPPPTAAPPVAGSGDAGRSDSCGSPFPSCIPARETSARPASRGADVSAASARGEARFCCGSAGDLLGSLFAPCTDASASSSSSAAQGSAGGRARSRTGAYAHSPCTGPREHIASQLVPFEGSGAYHCSGAAPQVAAARSPLVRCLGVLAGCLPHPYAATAHYVQSASALLGWEVLPLGAALDDDAKRSSMGAAALPAAAGTRSSQAESSPVSVSALFDAETYTSLPGKLVSLLSSPFAAADPAKTVPTDGVADRSGGSSAAAGGAAATDDFHWSQGRLAALLFPAGLLPPGRPLDEAKATRVALRRSLPLPAQRCYDAAPLGSHSLPRPIFLALRSAAEWQTCGAAQPACDRLAGACEGCRLSLPDDGGLMYTALTLPDRPKARAAAAASSSSVSAPLASSGSNSSSGRSSSLSGAQGACGPVPSAAGDNLFGPAVRDLSLAPAWAPLPTVL
jgi:hypothetical protein